MATEIMPTCTGRFALRTRENDTPDTIDCIILTQPEDVIAVAELVASEYDRSYLAAMNDTEQLAYASEVILPEAVYEGRNTISPEAMAALR